MAKLTPPSVSDRAKQDKQTSSIATWSVGVRCGTSPAPTVADTIGGTTASPQTVLGAPAPPRTSTVVKPMVVANPSTVPRIHSTPSISTPVPERVGIQAGRTVAVAAPTDSSPI